MEYNNTHTFNNKVGTHKFHYFFSVILQAKLGLDIPACTSTGTHKASTRVRVVNKLRLMKLVHG